MTPSMLLVLGLAFVPPSGAFAAPTAAVDATPGWLGDLAFDSKRGRWLVVSHAGPTYGRIMGNDGKPAGEAFVVSGAGQKDTWSPLAAYSPDLDRFLVVWMDFTQGASMWAAFVSGAGGAATPFRVPLEDVPGVVMLNVGGDRTSALRYDAANKKFVLVWEQRAPGSLVKLTTIDLEGKRGPVIQVGSAEGQGNWGPSVAVNEAKGEYCVAYDQRNTRRFAAVRVDAKTLAQGAESVVPIVTTNVDIAYNAKTKRYLVIYDAGYGVGVRGRQMALCDLKASSQDLLVLPKQGYAAAAANPVSGTFALIGQDGQDYGNFYSVVDGSGKTLARKNQFTASKKGNFLPVIRANTKDGTFAATTSRDYATTVFTARLGSGEGVAERADDAVDPKKLGWSWTHPADGQHVSGTTTLEGEATADVTHVDVLVNLKKVAEMVLSDGRWRYDLDTGAMSGGVNLSALVSDAEGQTARFTIRIDVAGPHPAH